VDDVRNSSALRIIDGLIKAGHPISAYDPRVKRCKGLALSARPTSAAQGAKVIAILTNDASFRELAWHKLARRGAIIYDAHGAVPPSAVTGKGLIRLGGAPR
jgi:UDP-N-acetyl-D-mannosaminuronate dehydrogenase